MVPSPRRLPHTISALEGDGFEPSVPLGRGSAGKGRTRPSRQAGSHGRGPAVGAPPLVGGFLPNARRSARLVSRESFNPALVHYRLAAIRLVDLRFLRRAAFAAGVDTLDFDEGSRC
jgi:hypothetical protein